MGKSQVASLCALTVVAGICLPLLAGCSSTPAGTGTTVKQVAELKGSGLVTGDEFGSSVAIAGTTAVVGSSGGAYAGRAYVFQKGASGWTEVAVLKGSDTTAGDRFGSAVAVSGTTAVVGAYDHAKDAGRAYVFQKTGSSWVQVAELKASDTVNDDYFGWSVAISGPTVMVGAVGHDKYTGRAYMFEKRASGWTETAELQGSGTVAEDGFGTSIGIDGTVAIVGAEGYAKGRGRAYLFSRIGSAWTQIAVLKASDTIDGDNFGTSVAIAPTTAVVGAYGRANFAGRAYVFEDTGTGWAQAAELKGSDTTTGDYFGISVAISGTSIVVGAYDHANDTGRGYVFEKEASGWKQTAELKGSDTVEDDYLGSSVAISGTTTLAGAYGQAKYAGRAYVFKT